MLNKQNQFFCDKGKNYFGRPNGWAIEYVASEWEESAEIEFCTPRFGFNGQPDNDCIYLEYDLMQLEAQCLCRIAQEMQTRIRANIDGFRIEIEPWENIATVNGEILAILQRPKRVRHSFTERLIAIFA